MRERSTESNTTGNRNSPNRPKPLEVAVADLASGKVSIPEVLRARRITLFELKGEKKVAVGVVLSPEETRLLDIVAEIAEDPRIYQKFTAPVRRSLKTMNLEKAFSAIESKRKNR